MPSGFSDEHRGPAVKDHEVTAARYGPAGFVAAFLNILVLEVLTWVILPWFMLLPLIVLPVVLVDALVAYGLTKRPGRITQVGRGMLIGCAAAPLTVLIFVPAWIIAQAVGPI
jgi:hypothetical protein